MKSYTKSEVDTLRRINGNMVMSTVHMASATGVSIENMNMFVGRAIEKLVRDGSVGQETLRYDATYKNSPMSDVVMECTFIKWKVYSTTMSIVTKTIADDLREEWKLFHEDVYGVVEKTPQQDIVEVEVVGDEICITSLQITEETGKDHKHVIRDIKKMLEELEIGESKFGLSYTTSQNKVLPMFILPKREAMILASGYSIKLRAGIIDKLDKLEKEADKKPTKAEIPNFEDPEEAAMGWLKEHREKKAALLEIKKKDVSLDKKDDLIKTSAAMSIEAGESTVSEFVKTLGIKEFGLQTCFAWMRERKYIMKNGEPYQKWINKGYFKHKPYKDNNDGRARFQPVIEARGRLALGSEIRKELEGDVA